MSGPVGVGRRSEAGGGSSGPVAGRRKVASGGEGGEGVVLPIEMGDVTGLQTALANRPTHAELAQALAEVPQWESTDW